MLTPERKQEIILANARHEGDTGSPEVQIAVLTERIKYLTEHLKGCRILQKLCLLFYKNKITCLIWQLQV